MTSANLLTMPLFGRLGFRFDLSSKLPLESQEPFAQEHAWSSAVQIPILSEQLSPMFGFLSYACELWTLSRFDPREMSWRIIVDQKPAVVFGRRWRPEKWTY